MNTYKEVVERVASSDGLVTDVDGVRHPVVPRPKLPIDFLSYSASSIKDGNLHAPIIYLSLWMSKNGSRRKISSLEHSLYSAVIKNSREEEFTSAGEEFSKNRVIEGYMDLVNVIKKNSKPVIACSRNPAAKYILKEATDFVTNDIIFENGVFKKANVKIITGEDKKIYVNEYIKERYGSSLKRFTYLGDACTDIPPGLEADIFLLSPHSSKKVRERVGMKGFVIPSYKQFARDLNKEMKKLKPLQA